MSDTNLGNRETSADDCSAALPKFELDNDLLNITRSQGWRKKISESEKQVDFATRR
jgi:hypothetical protein